jgi:hypothetical protein
MHYVPRSLLLGAALATSSLVAASRNSNNNNNNHDDDMTRSLQRTDIPAVPTNRFTPFELLEADLQTAALTVGWTTDTWNVPGTVAFEVNRYADLSADQQAPLTSPLDIDGLQWDCWINHYAGYFWNELESEAEVQDYWTALGWTENSWNEIDNPPATEEASWADLTDAEEAAATALCYNELTWDLLSLTTLITALPTQAPSVSAGPSAATQTMQPTMSPVTATPTVAPVTSSPTIVTTNSPTIMHVVPPRPNFRFLQFADLASETQAIVVNDLGYTETTWNQPATATVELRSFDRLTDDQEAAVMSLGISSESWDCHINHYEGLPWDQLNTRGVQQFFDVLGWTAESWAGLIDEPPSEAAGWDGLTAAEQAAAEQICFFEEYWNKDSLLTYGTVPPTQAPSTEAPTLASPSGGMKTTALGAFAMTAAALLVV